MTREKPKILIACRVSDQILAQDIAERLSKFDLDSFVDSVLIAPFSDAQKEEFKELVMTSDFFIFLASSGIILENGSIESSLVLKIKYALEKENLSGDRFVIPIKLDSRIDHTKLGYSSEPEWINLFSVGDFDPVVNRILNIILFGRDNQTIARDVSDDNKLDSVQDDDCLIQIPHSDNIYRMQKLIAISPIVKTYQGDCVDGYHCDKKVSIRVAKTIDDNEAIKNEAHIIKVLKTAKENEDGFSNIVRRTAIPILLDEVEFDDSSVEELKGRSANIIRQVNGNYTFKMLFEKFPNGIPPIHLAWIFDRLLGVLGYIHSCNIIHGGIDPSNIIVVDRDPDEIAHHRAMFTNFTFAISDAFSREYGYKGKNDFSPPELNRFAKPDPATDIYSLGLCVLKLSGGNVETKDFPVNMDHRIKDFLMKFIARNPKMRPRDAWQALHEFRQIRVRVFGKEHQLIHFD